MRGTAELLKEYQLKVTPQRLKIITILEEYGHLNIEDLYHKMLKEFPNVSLATIYKNINQMVESGLVQEVKLPRTKSVYELKKEPHLHMICSLCQKVEDIVVKTDKMVKSAEVVSGYHIKESFITLCGICPECRKSA
ncbi:MAG: transcriptional repressor [Hydrogenimonas sp.]|nr:MAG: transcriptional repressor [Hydrogenimonas sp.]